MLRERTSALPQKRSFDPGWPNVRLAPKAVIPLLRGDAHPTRPKPHKELRKAQPPGTIAARPLYQSLGLLNAHRGNTMAKKTYHGSCHCGAVAFEAKIDLDKGTTRCNCSICSKTRFWFALVQAADFKIEKGEDQLSDYTWIPPGKSKANLHYRFCKTCGVRAFGQGDNAAAGGKFYAVAIAALDDIGQDADQAVKSIKYVDGRHDDYEHEPADTRLL